LPHVTKAESPLKSLVRTPFWLDLAVTALLASVVTFLALPAFDATPSLYRDDAWTALVIKTDGLSEFLLVAVTAPGFRGAAQGLVRPRGVR